MNKVTIIISKSLLACNNLREIISNELIKHGVVANDYNQSMLPTLGSIKGNSVVIVIKVI